MTGGQGQALLAVADPGAGNQWVLTVPARHTYRVISMGCRFVCSATAANRRLILGADDGTHEWWVSVANSNMIANDACDWSAWCGGESVSFTSGAMQLGMPPDGLFLPAGYRLKSMINNLQATDVLSDIRVMVEDIPY